MNRIDSTYFIRERLLPLSTGAAGVPAARSTNKATVLDNFIAYYEKELCTLILGADLYAEYAADYATDKWKDFDALMIDSTMKDSPIADYIFCKYLADQDTRAGDGTLLVNGDAKNRVSYTVRTLPVWNAMIGKLIPAIEYLCENHATFCTTFEYNYEKWETFVWWDGAEIKGRFQNGLGL